MIILFVWTPAMPAVPVAPPVAPPIVPLAPSPSNPLIKIPKAGILGLIPSLLDLFFPAPLTSPQQEQDAIDKEKEKQQDFNNGGDWIMPPQLPFLGGQCSQNYDVNMEGIRVPSNTYFVTGATNALGPIEGLVINSTGGIALKGAVTPGNLTGIYPWFHSVCTETTNCVNPLKNYRISKIIPKPGQFDNCGNPPPSNTPEKEQNGPMAFVPGNYPLIPPFPQTTPLVTPLSPPTSEPSPSPDFDKDLEPKKIGSPIPFPQDSPLQDSPLISPSDTPVPLKSPSTPKDLPITPSSLVPPQLPKSPIVDSPISFDPTKNPELQPQPQTPTPTQTPTPDLCELIKNCADCSSTTDNESPTPKPDVYVYIQVTVVDVPISAKIIQGTTIDESVFWAGYFQVLFLNQPINIEYPIRRKTSIFSYPLDSKYSHRIIKNVGYNLIEVPLVIPTQ